MCGVLRPTREFYTHLEMSRVQHNIIAKVNPELLKLSVTRRNKMLNS